MRWLPMIACLTACGAPSLAVVETPTDRVREFVEQQNRRLVYPQCETAPPGRTCGFISAKYEGEKALAAFAARECTETAVSPECQRRFVDAFYRELHARYTAADVTGVVRYCAAYKCRGYRGIEYAYYRSHNDRIEASMVSAKEEL